MEGTSRGYRAAMTTTPNEQPIEDPDVSPGVTPEPVNPVDPGAGDEPDVRPSSDPL
jgi:hypothetical protein